MRRSGPSNRQRVLVLGLAAVLAGCARPRAGGTPPACPPEAAWTLRPLIAWIAQDGEATRSIGCPVREGLPPGQFLHAVAWGRDGDLWAAFDDGIGRIADPLSGTGVDLLAMPLDADGDALEPQVLAPGGPTGRLAVGTPDGYVAVSGPGVAHAMKAFPIRAEPERAGLMPWVGWTATGTVTASVHLTCEVVAIDPDTGRAAWRRTETVARYPSGSSNGRFLLLPWAEADAPAEILDAATGGTIATSARKGSSRDYGAVDDSGRWAVLGRYDEEIAVWDVTSNEVSTVRMEGQDARPIAFAFLPGSARCVVAAHDGIALLDVRARRWLARWSSPGGIRLAAFVPGGDLSVSPGGDRIAVRIEGGGLLVLAVSRAS